MSDNILKGACACFLILWVLGIANSSYVIINQQKLATGNITNDISYFSQITEDWTTKPFVDIKIMKRDENDEIPECPNDFPDEVVYKIWPGTRPYCDCTTAKTKKIYTDNDGKCPKI